MNLADYNYPQAPILGALVLFPIELIALPFIMAWLTIRAQLLLHLAVTDGSALIFVALSRKQ